MHAAREVDSPIVQTPNRATGPAGIFLLFVIFLTAGVYSAGSTSPLLLDDYVHLLPLIEDNDLQQHWRSYIFNDSGPLKRPIAMATFLFNAIASVDDFSRWKWTNVAIHLITGIFITYLVALLVSWRERKPAIEHWFGAVVIGAVWLLHPLHVSTVLYTVQRMTQLSALFVVLGLSVYVLARKRQLAGIESGSLLLIIISFAFTGVASLCKENGLLLPLYLLLIELAFFCFRGTLAFRGVFSVLFALLFLVPAVIGVIFLLLNDYFEAGYVGRGFTPGERLQSEGRVLMLYLYQLLVPIQRNMGFFYDDFAVSRGWLDPVSTIVSVGALALIVALAFFVRRQNPLFCFGILLFFCGHSLEAGILSLELAFEHRNYLPSLGIFLALSSLLPLQHMRKRVRTLSAASLLVVLAAMTFFRVSAWSEALPL